MEQNIMQNTYFSFFYKQREPHEHGGLKNKNALTYSTSRSVMYGRFANVKLDTMKTQTKNLIVHVARDRSYIVIAWPPSTQLTYI